MSLRHFHNHKARLNGNGNANANLAFTKTSHENNELLHNIIRRKP